MTKPTHVLSLLAAAKDLLRYPSNWAKSELETQGRYGLLGALVEARREFDSAVGQEQARASYECALGHLHQACKGSLLVFNDRPTTTHADILKAIDAASAARLAELDPSIRPAEAHAPAEPPVTVLTPAPAPAAPTFEALIDALLEHDIKVELLRRDDRFVVFLDYSSEQGLVNTTGSTKLEALQEAYNELRARQLAQVLP